ncbi:MAG: aminotransferase class V-fold PLP-dependent enzyme [Coriobacteriia bacterium]|nr:aminotransferase class V-fold PLP-dependent enzyme [Coriobacteriia bacterium]
MIYFDNSATTMFKPDSVIDRVTDYLKHSGNPGRGVNAASLYSGSIVYDTRVKVAEFFHFNDPSRVIFTSGVTESLNTVINSVVSSNDHVVISYLEHNSVLRPLYHSGCSISVTDGSIKEISKKIQKNTKCVIINHCSNVTGEIQDLKAIGNFCKDKSILFIVDCAQSAGIVDIDVVENNIDILAFTGHKAMLGMQGIGGILVNSHIKIEPLKRGGTGIHSFDKDMPEKYPEHLEAGTLNVPGIVSINAGIDYINDYGVENIYSHELSLRNYLLSYLATRKNVSVYKNDNKSAIGVVSFNFNDVDSAKLSDYLSTQHNIAIRSGAHCAPLALKHYNIESCARISFGINNTKKEIDILISALDQFVF